MRIFSLLLASLMILMTPAVQAQEETSLPTLPEPIKNLVSEGAQIRYLGRDHGFDAWLTIKGGQEQYFYVLPDRSAFVMGVLFDDQGKLVTLRQVKKLRDGGDPTLDELTEDTFAGLTKNNTSNSYEFKTPSEQLFSDVQDSNWVALGVAGAPVAYAFVDPQCPHCHAFVKDLKDEYLAKGKIQLRMIPIGFKEETRAQAAFLMAAPNPQERWFRHLEGDETALPAKSEINQQGVERNMAILQSWKLDVTPLIIYRGMDGGVKIIRGKPKDMAGFVADISPRS